VKKLIGVLVLVFVQGCTSVTTEDRNLISTGSSVGQNNLKKWDTLTDAQKREAQFNTVAAMVVLDHNVNEKAVPPEFQAFIDALEAASHAPAAPAPAAAPAGGK